MYWPGALLVLQGEALLAPQHHTRVGTRLCATPEWLNSTARALFSTWWGGCVCGVAIAGSGLAWSDGGLVERLVFESKAVREAGAQFEAVVSALETEYVEKVDPREVLRTSLEASLAKLDPYTEFEEARVAEDLATTYEGRYGGVGMVVGRRAGETIVVEAFEGYAFEAGIRASDRIVRVGGVEPASLEAARDALRGPPGSVVDVEYRHAWERESRRAELRRFEVRDPDLRVATLFPLDQGSAAYVKLALFSRATGPQARAALEALAPSAEAVILDLRGNPGGLLESAVDVASLFAPPGSEIVRASSPRLDQAVSFKMSDEGVRLVDRPLVVLVDGVTASASEIVAAFIQDLDLGVVLGERTFGKGLVQSVVDLPYGAKLKLTVGQYRTPSGRSLQEIDYANKKQVTSEIFATRRGRPVPSGQGVVPDVVVKTPKLPEADAFLVASGFLDAYVDDYLAEKKPDLAAKLFAASADDTLLVSQDGLPKRPGLPKQKIFSAADVLDFERFVLAKLTGGESSDLSSASKLFDGFFDDDIERPAVEEDAQQVEKRRKALLDDLAGAFRARPGQIAKLADANIRSRFFRSSATLRSLLDDDPQFAAAIALLNDPARYDGLLRAK